MTFAVACYFVEKMLASRRRLGVEKERRQITNTLIGHNLYRSFVKKEAGFMIKNWFKRSKKIPCRVVSDRNRNRYSL